MEITDEILIVAVRKAVEIGLLPSRNVPTEEYLKNWDLIKQILQAAFDKAQQHQSLKEKMTEDEYYKKKLEIEDLKKELAREYAESNNPYEIGDVIRDHIGCIRIEIINTYTTMYDLPSCSYSGLCLKKNGEPYKSGEIRESYQQNVIEKINPK